MPVPEGQGLGVHRRLDASTSTPTSSWPTGDLSADAQPPGGDRGRRRRVRATGRRRTAREGGGEPEGVIVTTLCAGRRPSTPSSSSTHLGSLVGDRDKFSAQNAARWQGARSCTCPQGVRVEAPIVLVGDAGDGRHGDALALADRGRGGRRADRGGAVPVRRRTTSTAYFNPVIELFVGEGANARVPVRPGPLGAAAGSSAASAPASERDASLHWVGLGLGSGAGQAADGDRPAGPRRRRPCHRRLRRPRPPAPRLRHDPGARRPRHDFGPRLPRHPARPGDRGLERHDPRRPGRAATDAFQESRNLLLSDGAHADAIPGLEIEANDVRCTHAATVSRIDEEQLFYLQSRGLDAS